MQWKKKITSVIRKPQLYRTREINEHIFGTIGNGATITQFDRVGKVNGEHNNYVGLQHQTL
jgi:hypothetical protein